MAATSGQCRHLSISVMIVKILGNPDTAAYQEAVRVVRACGCAVWNESHYYVDVAVAPLLTQKVSDEGLKEPIYGVLIFHPSPLPYGRGASSIRWAYRRKEPITAATWFWADSGYDTGPICEQEILKIDYEKRPRDFYEQDVIPAMKRTLERCLIDLQRGVKRAVPQQDKYSTFDPKI